MSRSDSRPRVRFGTSGWRGVLGDDFTFEGVRAVCRALAQQCGGARARPVIVVGHDTRFQGERLAEVAAGVLRASGARPILARGPVATPLVSFAVRSRRAAAGLIFTASHNSAEYQGLKVVAAWGGAAPPELTADLEARSARILAGRRPADAGCVGLRRVDLHGPYLTRLGRLLDEDRLARSAPRVFYDALHGAGAGLLDRALSAAGVRVEMRRGERDPEFGGGQPDPVPERLRELTRQVRGARGRVIGLATDGDADRFRVIDAGGRILQDSDAVALLIDHLARKGRLRRGVALTLATGSLPERVARAHGLPVVRAPIGFKHLTRALAGGVADVAGDESGGFAWDPFARDKDGILASCLLCELAADLRRPLRERLAELRRKHGARDCGRSAFPLGPGSAAALRRIGRSVPARFDGVRVLAASAEHGLRLTLEDGFVMLRVSGTEPVVRVYAEAPGPRGLARRLAAGARWIARA